MIVQVKNKWGVIWRHFLHCTHKLKLWNHKLKLSDDFVPIS